ncbi:hypothetical protein NG825_18225 [Xanthomonas sacchari]|nr:hypothetical protein NG825_18225 [Xanthomonas sacchari]
MPTVGFALDRYWDTHYRGQPWARERARYRPLESAATAAGPTQIPAPLQRQLAPQWRAPPPPQASASEAVSATPAWTPPGERMHQIPPPDALNPRYNKELAKELQRQDSDRRQRESMGTAAGAAACVCAIGIAILAAHAGDDPVGRAASAEAEFATATATASTASTASASASAFSATHQAGSAQGR